MMVTLPGLPMFGHGQIEGFHEKYGMEYDKAYYDEHPNQTLITRHEREIFPLLRRRHLFSGVDQFVFYDFISESGQTNEDVFVFSNRKDIQSALVIYHNKWNERKGTVRESVDWDGNQHTLGPSLGFENISGSFILFKDHISGLEFIHSTEEFFNTGLELELSAYEYHVFLDFRQVSDTKQGDYASLNRKISGRGVKSIETELNRIRFRGSAIFLEKFFTIIQKLLPSHTLLTDQTRNKFDEIRDPLESEPTDLSKVFHGFYQAFGELLAPDVNYKNHAAHIEDQIMTYLSFLPRAFTNQPHLKLYPLVYTTILSWVFFAPALDLFPFHDINPSIAPLIHNVSPKICASDSERQTLSLSLSIALTHSHSSLLNLNSPSATLRSWLENENVRQFLHVHDYEGIQYYQQEGFDYLLLVLEIIERLQILADGSLSSEECTLMLGSLRTHHEVLREAHNLAKYQIHPLLEKVSELESRIP
jgi:hypothetical protein